MFLKKIENIFCVSDTNFVSATNVARTGKRGSICVCNIVSSFATTLRRDRVYHGATGNILQAIQKLCAQSRHESMFYGVL